MDGFVVGSEALCTSYASDCLRHVTCEPDVYSLPRTRLARPGLVHMKPAPASCETGAESVLTRITRRRRWGARHVGGNDPSRRTPRRSEARRFPLRQARCDARVLRDLGPCRSRCGGSGPPPACDVQVVLDLLVVGLDAIRTRSRMGRRRRPAGGWTPGFHAMTRGEDVELKLPCRQSRPSRRCRRPGWRWSWPRTGSG